MLRVLLAGRAIVNLDNLKSRRRYQCSTLGGNTPLRGIIRLPAYMRFESLAETSCMGVNGSLRHPRQCLPTMLAKTEERRRARPLCSIFDRMTCSVRERVQLVASCFLFALDGGSRESTFTYDFTHWAPDPASRWPLLPSCGHSAPKASASRGHTLAESSGHAPTKCSSLPPALHLGRLFQARTCFVFCGGSWLPGPNLHLRLQRGDARER
jgi:hypothetical protein